MDRSMQDRFADHTQIFDYAGKLTEIMLLGCIALRVADKYPTLQWDGPNMRLPTGVRPISILTRNIATVGHCKCTGLLKSSELFSFLSCAIVHPHFGSG
ncbi:MAG: hypothetical protein CM1200mP10_03830 [Candidatus Neomarinimicrobiota bacterium]|nr:MAG: hypothetical protein CM1200mP10_03830 [Candidatus Neomarinimicrobiota bacterium]